ncbi:hypothetical protein KFU94_35250 [Chloroflexi bacterium TSY]|nr:hypothetical protein [Chloroflexi bacterium TSY]
MNEIYETYKEKVNFFCVYIKEAHPEDNVGAYQTKSNRDEGIVYDQPTTIGDRAQVAEACMLHLNLKMPMPLDNIANEAEGKYVAAPERLYIIDKDGVLSYRGDPGPHGFNKDEWVEVIEDLSLA